MLRYTTVSATDEYRARTQTKGALTAALLNALNAPFPRTVERSQSQSTDEEMYDMSSDSFDEDDPGAWVREADEQRSAAEYSAMLRHRYRFERDALEAERAVGRTLEHHEYRSIWDRTSEDRAS